MSPSLTAKITHGLALSLAVVFVLLPFHAFLTVWFASVAGHYTLLRLWKEFVLVLVGLVALWLLFRDKPLQRVLRGSRFISLIGVYIVLQLFLGFTSALHHQVSAEALAYGLLDDSRFLLFFVLCGGIAIRDDFVVRHWRPLFLIPAVLVILFGLLEITLLPHDFLQHFGYGPHTIPVFEAVNSNLHYIRAQSTLRGANPLGAYLVLILALVSVCFLRSTTKKARWSYGAIGLLGLALLYGTYSRGAWLGTVLALGCILLVCFPSRSARQLFLGVVLCLVIAGGGTAFAFRHSSHFENILFHTSPHTVATTSDQNHSSAVRQGLQDLAHDPLGRGPGTAGPASVYNHDRPARIPENYFIQLGQETGWLGLLLFISICVLLGQWLWHGRSDPLLLALFGSLIGISVVGLFSEVWTDDTLSYLWWGLAGSALLPSLLVPVKATASVKPKS